MNVNVRQGYRCCCTKDYYGVNCENKTDTNICDAVTCENGGTCIANEENFTCNCLPGFEGSYCELNIDDCTKFLCDNDGVCVDGINNATCDCPSKFTGLHCETGKPTEDIEYNIEMILIALLHYRIKPV